MPTQKIKFKNGRIKSVSDHLAFDANLQKQSGFVPCDDDGNPLPGHVLEEKKSNSPMKSQSPAAAVSTAGEELKDKGLDVQILEAHKRGQSYQEIAKANGIHWKKVEAIVEGAKAKEAPAVVVPEVKEEIKVEAEVGEKKKPGRKPKAV